MGSYMVGSAVALILLQAFGALSAYQLDARDVNIQCEKEGFIVTVNKEKASAELDDFSFIDQSCRSAHNGSHLVASTAYTQCGTIKRETGHGIEYTNELLNPNYVITANDGVDDVPCPHLKLKVTCFLPTQPIGLNPRKRRSVIEGRVKKTTGCPRKYAFDSPNDINSTPEYVTCPFLIGIGETFEPDHVLINTQVGTAIKIKDKSNRAGPCKPLNRRGQNIRLVMSLYSDRTFTDDYDRYTQEQASASYTYTDVFYKIQHLSGHDNFKMVPMTCYATPDPNPENPISYYYITNGCPVDPTVKFYKSSESDGSSRFSITSFQFVNSDSRAFFSHCHVLVCDKNDQSEQCNPSCQRQQHESNALIRAKRTRRSDKIFKTSEENVEVDCLADRMIIRIKKSSSNTFYLNDPKCNAKLDGNFITLTTPYNGCGTKFVEEGNKFYYSNQVVERVPGSLKIIRGPLLKQQVNCALKKSISSSAVIRLKRKRLRAIGVGSYKVQIDMYTDKTFTTRNTNSLIEIDENQNMYFGVKVTSKAFRDTLELHLDTCLGYNQPKKSEERKTHIFIKNGCPRDDSVRFYPNIDGSQVRFSVKPFKFDGETSIMVNCFVTACSVNDQDSKCKQMQNAQKNCNIGA